MGLPETRRPMSSLHATGLAQWPRCSVYAYLQGYCSTMLPAAVVNKIGELVMSAVTSVVPLPATLMLAHTPVALMRAPLGEEVPTVV